MEIERSSISNGKVPVLLILVQGLMNFGGAKDPGTGSESITKMEDEEKVVWHR
jgi:hypothetical protein